MAQAAPNNQRKIVKACIYINVIAAKQINKKKNQSNSANPNQIS
jgi:hypothetical protein